MEKNRDLARGVGSGSGIGFKVMAAPGSPDSYRVASLVNDMEGVTPAG